MPPLTFVNARMTGTESTTLRVAGNCIVAVGSAPEADDHVVDLRGDRLLPGLINAHDHLQLNSLPSTGLHRQYSHVREWIADVDSLRSAEPEFQAGATAPREERLLIGGIKNLLSGVTTVAHHDPFYSALSAAEFPVQVVAEYGWSHSLYLDGAGKTGESFRRTPSQWPWIVHAAEGIDARAAEEFEQLDALGCLGPNTVLVHGIALDDAQQKRLIAADGGLIWCPSSNLRLFGRTADIRLLQAAGRVAIGTDSRLSGARDLLDELRIASDTAAIEPQALESLVTMVAARLLRLPDRGMLRAGLRADLMVLPADKPLSRSSRADVRLVLVNGRTRYGDEVYVRSADAHHDRWATVSVDGHEKWLDRDLVTQLSQAGVREQGLQLS